MIIMRRCLNSLGRFFNLNGCSYTRLGSGDFESHFPNGAQPSSLFYFNMFVLTTHPHKVHEYPDYDILASAAVPLFFYVSCGCAIANLLTASKL